MRHLTIVFAFLFLATSAAHAGGPARAVAKAPAAKRTAKAPKRQAKSQPRGIKKLFSKLAKKKGDRVFHAEGQAYHGTIKQPDGKVKPAIIRLSRGGAGKAGKQDILGVAVKVQESGGRSQDFLMVTALAARGIGTRIPSLRSAFGGKKFSSLTSFRVGNLRGPITSKLPKSLRTLMDLASPGVSAQPQTFKLELQNRSLFSRLVRRAAPRLSLGEVTVDFSRQLSAKENAALTMTPFNNAGGVEPVGVINGMRRGAYEGSQSGRGAR